MNVRGPGPGASAVPRRVQDVSGVLYISNRDTTAVFWILQLNMNVK